MSTKQQIDVSYGVSNDFFRLWLDDEMVYSGALFQEPGCSLEEAQRAKLRHHCRAARVAPGSRVLDIGCGWGALLAHLVTEENVAHAHGLTLSVDQYKGVVERKLPNTSVDCVSYEDFVPDDPFDAAISIGMFEHLATPSQARSGESSAIYERYFELVREWTRPESWFSLQTVIGGRIPRGRALRELGWATHSIFPGAISPRLNVVFDAAKSFWDVVDVWDRGEHYARTTAEWLRRLTAQQDTVVARWGRELYDEYHRYLSACVMVFEEGYQSLAQIALRRRS